MPKILGNLLMRKWPIANLPIADSSNLFGRLSSSPKLSDLFVELNAKTGRKVHLPQQYHELMVLVPALI